MGAAISDQAFFKVNTMLRLGVPSLVINNSSTVKSLFGNRNNFCLLALNPHNNYLVGSTTWGTSGFDFEIFFERNSQTKKYEILYVIDAHTGLSTAAMGSIDNIVESHMRTFSTKTQTIIDNGNDWDGRSRPQGYNFGRKNISTVTSTYRSHLDDMLNTGLITDKFKNFAIKYGDRYVLAKH